MMRELKRLERGVVLEDARKQHQHTDDDREDTQPDEVGGRNVNECSLSHEHTLHGTAVKAHQAFLR